MTPSLEALRREGVLSALDVQFARCLGDLSGAADELSLLAAALSSRDTRAGHVCIDLARVAGTAVIKPDGDRLDGVFYPALGPWLSAVRASGLVSESSGDGATQELSPLVLSGGARLYLRRYHDHEARLARLLLERAATPIAPGEPAALRRTLRLLFGEPGADPDLQRTAAMLSATAALTVISGGPGTGKTSTVVRLSALVLDQLRHTGTRRPRALFLAPTGKAAARLVDSVKRAKAKLPPDLAALIPEEASTIHRALGPVGRSATRFRHGPERQLFADLVIVDEASMVDVALMRRLVEAVPARARLVLLGDADQLSSVEAGAVLADICGDGSPGYSPHVLARLRAAFGEAPGGDGARPLTLVGSAGTIDDCVVRLTRSYRFDGESAIGRLAAAIRSGDAAEAVGLLRAGHADVRFVAADRDAQMSDALARLVVDGYRPAVTAPGGGDALARLDGFRVLCAHRKGTAGVEEVNAFVEQALARAQCIRPTNPYYEGRPLLVTQNDYQVGLFNGDQGLAFRDPSGAPRVQFLGTDGHVRAVTPARLPPHETAYALSVHKSQGSEYEEVVVLLPDPGSPLLSRELLYTACSRARRRVTIFGTVESVERAVESRVQRATGLKERLRQPLRRSA